MPEIGDVAPISFLGLPLLLVRDEKKIVRVFQNTCSHRGMILIEQKSNVRGTIRCPYHSWSYNFSGELVVTPHIGGINIHQVEGFDKDKSNLKKIRSKSGFWLEVWMYKGCCFKRRWNECRRNF